MKGEHIERLGEIGAYLRAAGALSKPGHIIITSILLEKNKYSLKTLFILLHHCPV
jgi:hypothetical protein